VKTPSVSVVIPAYNVARYIGETLASVVAQSLTDWECIVVDDGSTDQTAEVVGQAVDPRIRLIQQKNAGVSAARNLGFQSAFGDTVLFLDGDDTLHPTALERLYSFLSAHAEVIACFGALLRTDTAGQLEPGQKALDKHVYASGQILEAVVRHERAFSNGGQLLIRRDAVAAAGGYDPALRLSEDWEFWCRLASRGQIAYIGPQDEIMRLRVHAASSSSSLAVDWRNHKAAIEKVMANKDLSSQFTPETWRAMGRSILSVHMFEAGRQNFRARRFREARSLMFRALKLSPSPRNIAIFLLAQASQLLNRPLIGRLRFIERSA
jgi:glycosyltransferase involved in cell wall biosynthesis